MKDLQSFLVSTFSSWSPSPPILLSRTRHSVTLQWKQDFFGFLHRDLLYRVDRKEKVPPWVVAYSGGKTEKEIVNLSPSTPYKFRVRVTLRPEAVTTLAKEALAHFGSKEKVCEAFCFDRAKGGGDGANGGAHADFVCEKEEEIGVKTKVHKSNDEAASTKCNPLLLRSEWSEVCWAATDAVGQTPASFCMAVRGGYDNQVQKMLEERPALLEMINTSNGYTPLATAAMKGNVGMVNLLLSAGAEVDALSANTRTALHVALLGGHKDVAKELLNRRADLQARDVVGLRAEHCAVDGGSLDALSLVIERGGDLGVTDYNGWTPLFRAVVGGASTPILRELISAGSEVNVADRAGLPLLAAARVMKDHSGKLRESAIRAVDPAFSHETASKNFTRLTRKIRTLCTAIQHDDDESEGESSYYWDVVKYGVTKIAYDQSLIGN